MDNIEYTAEQQERAVELWERILACYNVSLSEVWKGYYGSYSHSYLERATEEHLAALIESNGEETDDYRAVEITLMAYSDYGGSDLDAANIRALDGTPGINTSRAGIHGERSATMTLGELPGDDTESVDDGLDRLEHIADMMTGLSDYPLIDDEIHSQYVDELADEAWDAYLCADIVSDLERVALDGWEITDGVTAELRTAYYGYENNEWYCETATSVINGRHDDALAHAALTVLGWDYPKREAKRKARVERIQREREAFTLVWQEFRTAYPLAYWEQWGGHSREDGAYRLMRERGQLPATLESVLAMVREQAEIAAYRDAESMATTV